MHPCNCCHAWSASCLPGAVLGCQGMGGSGLNEMCFLPQGSQHTEVSLPGPVMVGQWPRLRSISLAITCLGQTFFKKMHKLFDLPTLFQWQIFHMLLNSISFCFSLPINTIRIMMEPITGPCQESGWNNKLFYHTLKMYFINLKKYISVWVHNEGPAFPQHL